MGHTTMSADEVSKAIDKLRATAMALAEERNSLLAERDRLRESNKELENALDKLEKAWGQRADAFMEMAEHSTSSQRLIYGKADTCKTCANDLRECRAAIRRATGGEEGQ